MRNDRCYLVSFTLLPALIEAVKPPDEPKPLSQPVLAPADNFLKTASRPRCRADRNPRPCRAAVTDETAI